MQGIFSSIVHSIRSAYHCSLDEVLDSSFGSVLQSYGAIQLQKLRELELEEQRTLFQTRAICQFIAGTAFDGETRKALVPVAASLGDAEGSEDDSGPGQAKPKRLKKTDDLPKLSSIVRMFSGPR